MKLQVGVKILLENDRNQYLFLRRSRQVESQSGAIWDIPGGRIEPAESLLVALERELREETDLKIVGKPILLTAQDIFSLDRTRHVVRLTYLGKAVGDISLSDEHSDFAWMNKDELRGRGEATDQYLSDLPILN